MTISGMAPSLLDRNGNRKYLVARERLAFVRSARAVGGAVGVFCLTLAFTGARISEVLALAIERIDTADDAVVFRTLKQRKKTMFRAVPVPTNLIAMLSACAADSNARIFPWGRTTAWKAVKAIMRNAGIAEGLCKPKALANHGNRWKSKSDDQQLTDRSDSLSQSVGKSTPEISNFTVSPSIKIASASFETNCLWTSQPPRNRPWAVLNSMFSAIAYT